MIKLTNLKWPRSLLQCAIFAVLPSPLEWHQALLFWLHSNRCSFITAKCSIKSALFWVIVWNGHFLFSKAPWRGAPIAPLDDIRLSSSGWHSNRCSFITARCSINSAVFWLFSCFGGLPKVGGRRGLAANSTTGPPRHQQELERHPDPDRRLIQLESDDRLMRHQTQELLSLSLSIAFLLAIHWPLQHTFPSRWCWPSATICSANIWPFSLLLNRSVCTWPLTICICMP